MPPPDDCWHGPKHTKPSTFFLGTRTLSSLQLSASTRLTPCSFKFKFELQLEVAPESNLLSELSKLEALPSPLLGMPLTALILLSRFPFTPVTNLGLEGAQGVGQGLSVNTTLASLDISCT